MNFHRKSWFKYTAIGGISSFFLLAMAIVIFGMNSKAKRADVIVVLGNKVMEDGKPSPRLQARLDKAVLLYQSEMATAIIVSGGIGKEGFDESAVMANYLVERGIDHSKIFRDSLGLNSYLTAQNSKDIMQAHGFHSAIIVSHYYHLLRCRLAFRNWGIKNVSCSRELRNYSVRDVWSICREVIGLPYYWLRPYPQKN